MTVAFSSLSRAVRGWFALWALGLVPLIALSQGVYFGTGLKLGLTADGEGHPLVDWVVPRSSASKAGVQCGDPVISVDGQPTAGRDFGELVRGLGGEAGRHHRIEFGKPNKTAELVVEEVRGRCVTGDCDNGEGLWEDVFGDLYSGRFREGRYHGFGRLENGTNYVFEGEFQAGEFHGRGILVDHGRVFSGHWKEGREANGSGSLTLPDGSQFEGEGDWINGFTGRGAFVDPKRQLRAEGEFERANGLGGIRGTGSIRSLVTGSVYRGRFERGEPAGPGEVEMAAGARLPVRFHSMTALIVGLGQTNPAALGGDRKTGELVIESVPEPVGSPPAERQAKPGRVNLTGTGKRVSCAACGGSGFQLRSCGWCGGQGSVSRPVTTYKRKDTPFAARSVYDSAGRFVGNSSGYDVTYYHVITPHEEECRQCRGTGARTTNVRCPVCRGGGSVEGR